jgi:uncharacterized protein with beta-barrel porin domain
MFQAGLYGRHTMGAVYIAGALDYGWQDVTASRSELGLRGDTSFAMQDAVLTLRSRAAWGTTLTPTAVSVRSSRRFWHLASR